MTAFDNFQRLAAFLGIEGICIAVGVLTGVALWLFEVGLPTGKTRHPSGFKEPDKSHRFSDFDS
jgi:hypothetical protein